MGCCFSLPPIFPTNSRSQSKTSLEEFNVSRHPSRTKLNPWYSDAPSFSRSLRIPVKRSKAPKSVPYVARTSFPSNNPECENMFSFSTPPLAYKRPSETVEKSPWIRVMSLASL